MSAITDAKQQILTDLKLAIGEKPSPDELESPRDPSMGDLAYPCFQLAKSTKRDPAELAREIAAKIGPKKFVASAEAVGSYVNFRLNASALAEAVFKEVKKEGENYGSNKSGAGTRVMVEFAQPNTHKQIHVGHLRNFIVGQMAADVLKANGYEVIPVCYINDLGAHVATCLWGLEKFHKGENPDKNQQTKLLGQAYVEATREVEKNKKVKEEISSIFNDLEEGKGQMIDLWKKTREWSLDEMHNVFHELGLDLEKWYFESDLIEETRDIINDLIKKEIAERSQGAWIVNLEDKNLGVNLLVKTDGSLLYNAKDLALAMRKEADYAPARSIYIIDARQALAMKQLFETLRRMGFERELSHLSYEFVTLKSGAMASRKGNIIRYQDFRDHMIDKASEETANRHPDWSVKQIKESAAGIAYAAMRFGMLRQDMDKKIIFDEEEALSFDGFTGPYLLYTYTRLSSILRKAGKLPKEIDTSVLTSPEEHALIMDLANYPQVIFETGSSLKLSAIAHFVFDLCKQFSFFYESIPVIQADEPVRSARLQLVAAVRQVVGNGLKMMGIDPVEEM